MSLKPVDEPKTFDDVSKMYQGIKDDLGFEDLKIGNMRTVAPTTATLEKGKFAFAEISNVPTLYYRNTNGTIYKFTGTV